MSNEQVVIWIKNGIDAFIPEYIFFYQQALSEFDKDPDRFDATTRSNAEDLRKKL